jgi:hypothetical protein
MVRLAVKYLPDKFPMVEEFQDEGALEAWFLKDAAPGQLSPLGKMQESYQQQAGRHGTDAVSVITR